MDLSKRIVAWLDQRKQNHGVMSDLRRSLRDETHSRAWSHINIFCDLTKTRDELLTRTVCGLYALHSSHSDKVGNFGESLRRLALKRGGIELHERYLKRLSSAQEMPEVCERLPFIVRMMKNEGVQINYERLHNDLYWWGMNPRDRERVAREWCQGYYREKEKTNVPDQNISA